MEGADSEKWLGIWNSDTGNGEYLNVTKVNKNGIVLIYHGLTASGESYFDSEYKLSFVNPEMTIALEEDSVIAMSGWKYTFILNDGYITMLSRYPDQNFYKE